MILLMMCSREYLESPSVTEPSGLQEVTEAMLQRQQDQNENRLQLIASLKYVKVWEGTGNGELGMGMEMERDIKIYSITYKSYML